MSRDDVLREYTGTDDREVVPVAVFADAESMGETMVAMLDEIVRLRRFELWFDLVDANRDFAAVFEDMILYYGHPRAPSPRGPR
jgi:hypothetical protein